MKPDYNSRENWREEKSAIDKRFQNLSEVEKFAIGALFGAIVTGVVGFLIVHRGDSSLLHIVEDFYTNFSTEFLSIAITILIIDRLYKRRADEEEKKRLILQMGSPDNAFAVEASRQLRANDWLTDGSLKGAYLWGANLKMSPSLEGAQFENVNLSEANFENTNLRWCNFTEAVLQGANLAGANLDNATLYQAKVMGANFSNSRLSNANLQKTSLWYVQFQKADLRSANLQNISIFHADMEGIVLFMADLQNTSIRESSLKYGILEAADLSGAYLQNNDMRGVNLINSNLEGATIKDVWFDESTLLPDDTGWEKGTNMERFTNPNHPEFWQPSWVKGEVTRGRPNNLDLPLA